MATSWAEIVEGSIVRINSVRGYLELSHGGAEHEEAEEAVAGSQCLQVSGL